MQNNDPKSVVAKIKEALKIYQYTPGDLVLVLQMLLQLK